ncbi:MAG TPA: maltose alpha-D-glucosyltransferase [Candidatus Acidoferrales bacterium]|nr:maltose alpha-D-glucosyltransferase [Candidatus Acidoferrales bacterium]
MRDAKKKAPTLLDADPLWYRDAIIYELHVRAFCDSNGDGIGDFVGLTQKLDYLQDLGITAVWLLPFYPSPQRDDGYDISDYTAVHPHYGTLQDFKTFLREAHARGIRVITELVLNHTSDQHPWFQRARRAKPGTSARNFYVWSDTPEKYPEARIIFKDFESSNWSWDPVAKAYYWHRFYSHQPDLNFDHPEVRKGILNALDFWLDMGVDGLRLDAVPYLYEREGTICENLPETHEFLRELRRHVDRNYSYRMLLAEANQWPEDAAAYFGRGDECHMAFHFPVMPRLFMAIYMEDHYPIIDIMDQTPQIPETCQWAVFLRNHDELTLEMVTDEDRDYMYKVYARDPQARINLGIRRRLAPLLGNNRRKIELMNSLLFSLPGTPIIYYGDEIGMGDNIYLGDRNGVRTPMQWSADRNAGFSRANPQRLYLPVNIDPEYHYEAVNVEAQQYNQHSILWWMKRLIQLRKRHRAFGRGAIEFIVPDNRKILVFIRRYQDESILVVVNLSRFVQFVELDLSSLKGTVPVEMIGQIRFPPIGELPYFITLGPHSFYWFKLETPAVLEVTAKKEPELPALEVYGSWEEAVRGNAKSALEKILPAYLPSCRWFGGKAHAIRSAKITGAIPLPYDSASAQLAFVEVQYQGRPQETYILPLGFAAGERAAEIRQAHAGAVVAEVRARRADGGEAGILYDAVVDSAFCKALLAAIVRRRSFKSDLGTVVAWPSRALKSLPAPTTLEPALMKREQSNTSVVFGDQWILKIFRRAQDGVNPDLEIGRFITERTSFRNIPLLGGALELRRAQGEPVTLGILQSLVPNVGDAWGYTLDNLGRYFDDVLALPQDAPPDFPHRHLLALSDEDLPPLARHTIGSYLASAELLGQRTAELHGALASDGEAAFTPEPFTSFYRRSLYQSMRSLANQALTLLARRVKSLPEEARAGAERVLAAQKQILDRLQVIRDRKISALRIRCHGDFHLGQVLYTGKDFVIIDFEGEPARPISERRLKRSPVADVAGMLRSFSYATAAKLRGAQIRAEDRPRLMAWARFWSLWVSAAFLRAYLQVARRWHFLPASRDELAILLDVHLLEKAVYELGYELNNRPDWVTVPIQGILEQLEAPG